MARFYPGNNLFFNDVDIASISGVVIEDIDIQRPPKRLVEAYKRARAHGQVLVSSYYDFRPIIVRGKFVCNTQAEFELARDVLLAAIQNNGVMKTLVAGALRCYNCILEDPDVPEQLGGYASFTLNFRSYDPFGYDVAYTQFAGQNITTQYNDTAVTFGGTAPIQYPVITLTVNSISGATTASTLNFMNDNTGQLATWTGLPLAGDVFVFNTELGQLFKNGSPAEFSGAMPVATPVLTTFTYSDTGISSRSINRQIGYLKRYV